ncbi:MAG: bifunctional folylpolyglutamate synthase/dihydrofolate synthase [Pelagibacteraceae bacterium]|jgi:dihydrofolate synthase/folylpolyglutamate synthase|nr:bifunctional folylpolyglutamate synthase/dihydrofolate synthase [Pelagibacteraceae bacterium]
MNQPSKLQWILNDLYRRRSPDNIKLTLDRVKQLLLKLGSPEKNLENNSVIFLGSNAKYSTLKWTQAILEGQGLTTNAFISPHVSHVTERIEFQGKPITEDEFIHYLTIVEKHADEDVTFFEILCAMAFLGFNEKKADINLIEVGLGYIFDATRTIENPLITVICPISLEHRNFLGPELKDVVRNKVSDISKKTNIIISKQDPANLKYMDEYLSKNPSKKFYLSEEFNIHVEDNKIIYQDNDCLLDIDQPKHFPKFQLSNLACAIQAAKLISNTPLDATKISSSIFAVEMPARFQKINDPKLLEYVNVETTLYVCGSHNPQSAKATREALEDLNTKKPVFMVFAMNKSKDLKEYLKQFASITTELLAVQLRDGFYSTDEIIQTCDELGMKARPAAKNNAISPIMQISIACPDSLILVCGSFELCGSLLQLSSKQ